MARPRVSYEEALQRSDKASITAVRATTGTVARIGELANVTLLDLSENPDIKDFGFLRSLERLEELHLDKMGLTAIPGEVAALPNLTTLFLGGNAIQDFAVLAKLPKLVDLGLEEMGLKKLPDVVAKLTQLRVLGLNGNELQAIADLKKLTALEELYVANNKLKQVPKELASLPKLRVLWIAQNYKLTNWDVVGKLAQLEELSMSNAHDIPTLPAWIFDLVRLRKLELSVHWNAPADKLAGISNIGALDQLEELSIDGSSIKGLPDGIGKLTKLRKLILRDNKHLADISALRDLPALRELDLSKCAIVTVPEAFSSLKALEILDLSDNEKLADIAGVRDLPALHTLTLRSELETLPKSLGTLTGLKKLTLSAATKDVGFLEKLTKLEELDLYGCQFATLPATLKQLRDLTINRTGKVGDDRYLEAYGKLERLSVMQSSFTLPKLPALKRLSVGGTTSIDLAALGAELEELEIHRSDGHTAIPNEVTAAKGLVKLKLEFLDKLTDLGAVRDLPALQELELNYCKKLTALPGHLATLPGLEVVQISSMETLQDLDVLGQLPELRVLELDSLDALVALPPSLARLRKLERIRLYSMGELKDISVLARVASLRKLESEYLDSVPRKMLAEVQNAIASRGATASATTYAGFISSGAFKRLRGKEDSKRAYGFPLRFDRPKALRAALSDFSWLDDVRDDDNELAAILTDDDSALVPLAILDFGHPGCDTSAIDAYAEEIFLVDTADVRNPVLIWTHDGQPTKIHDSFDDFLANLRDFAAPAKRKPARKPSTTKQRR